MSTQEAQWNGIESTETAWERCPARIMEVLVKGEETIHTDVRQRS